MYFILLGSSFSHSLSISVDIDTMAYTSSWVDNSVNESVYGCDGMEAHPCRFLRDYIQASEIKDQEP